MADFVFNRFCIWFCLCSSCLFIEDDNAPDFSLDNPLYRKQIEKGLVINVLRSDGVWGSYRHLPLKCDELIYSEFGCINVANSGDLSSLTWVQSHVR